MGFSPVYSIHQYREDFYKVVAFKGVRDSDVVYVHDRSEGQHYDKKLDNNFSRARSMVLQYALCNPWEYFFTGTLDRNKFDRYDLDLFTKTLSQFIRDKRKKYGVQLQVLLVPEEHKKGAWHIHGLVHNLPDSVLRPFHPPEPQNLIDGGFLNWPDYMEKFGFCSLAPIKDPTATAFYITKYVSKDLSRRADALGKHLYFHSRPLKKAVKASDIYIYHRELDGYCVNEYEFCKTGMVENVPWYFPYVWDGADFSVEPMTPQPVKDPLEDFQPQTIDPFYEQLKIKL